jgi:predicted nucleic acid-binding protein
MLTYADTSFIVALYLIQGRSYRAIEIAERLSEPLPLTPLLLLDFRNALNLAIKRGEISTKERDDMWKNLEREISDGAFVRISPSVKEVNRLACQLSDRHGPTIGPESLNLLHLASAKILGVKKFITFETRQAQAGKAEGFKIIN